MTTRRRRTTVVAAISALALLAAACGSDDDSSDSTEAPSTEAPDSTEAPSTEAAPSTDAADDGGGSGEPFTIGIVAPSASNDLAFTQSMVDSVDRLGETREIEVAITDGTFVVEDAAAAIRGYAEDGLDLVIAHGSQYGGPLQEIAPDFPETAFAWGTAVDTFDLPNVSAYTVSADQGGYVNGIMAAQLTESNVLGVIGPIEVGDAKLYVDGFVAGVAAQNPDATTNVNYIDSFSDVLLASEAATAHIENGADVLTGTAQMVVGATGEASSAGIPWFGTQSNQTDLGPEIVVASQVYHWEVSLEELLDAIEGGTLGGEVYTLTLENGGLVMEFNDGLRSRSRDPGVGRRDDRRAHRRVDLDRRRLREHRGSRRGRRDDVMTPDRGSTDAGDARDHQALPGGRRQRRRRPHGALRSGAHVARRERRRQEHADEDPLRPLPARRGHDRPARGEVTIDSPNDAIERGIGMIHQHFMLVPTLTVAENVALGLGGRRGLVDLPSGAKRLGEVSERTGSPSTPTPTSGSWRSVSASEPRS